jgi:hypothetical protein
MQTAVWRNLDIDLDNQNPERSNNGDGGENGDESTIYAPWCDTVAASTPDTVAIDATAASRYAAHQYLPGWWDGCRNRAEDGGVADEAEGVSGAFYQWGHGKSAAATAAAAIYSTL